MKSILIPVAIAVLICIVIVVCIFIFRLRKADDSVKSSSSIIEAQQTLISSYEHDELTGITSRHAALHHLNQELAPDSDFTMLLMGIDNLNPINETYGHESGDEIIIELARRLSAFCKADELHRSVARYDGAEFLVTVRGQRLIEGDAQILELMDLASEPVVIDELRTGADPVWMSLSIGAAASDGESSPQSIIRRAVLALSKARTDNDDSICVYSDELKAEIARRNEVKGILARAIKNDDIYMLYQPQVDLISNKITGYEALMRIRGCDISPAEFIPVAESSGFIRQVGRISTRLVIEQLAEWKQTGMDMKPVSLNYSSMQMGDAGYLDFTLGLLEEHDVDASLIEMEITEGLFVRKGKVAEELFGRLQKAGVKILMDDFGTGYSSLSYLTYIPVDIIKLDKSIIETYLTLDSTSADEGGNAFVRDLIRIAHDLDKTILVEGVEQEWQVKLLTAYGCDIIQGFYYSCPLPAHEIPDFRI